MVKKCLFCHGEMKSCGIDDNGGNMQIYYFRCQKCNINSELYVDKHKQEELLTVEKNTLVDKLLKLNYEFESSYKNYILNFIDEYIKCDLSFIPIDEFLKYLNDFKIGEE